MRAIQLQDSSAENIFDHLQAHKHSNMHLREKRQVKGKQTLRYLHMMILKDGIIHGKVAGPTGISIEYQIFKNGKVRFLKTQFKIQKELDNFFKYFETRILNRISSEKNRPEEISIQRAKDEFYLMRGSPGSKMDSKNVKRAQSLGTLPNDFLEALSSWKFYLVVGKGPRKRS